MNITLLGKPDGKEDGSIVPQNNLLVRAWMPASFMDLRWGRQGNKLK